jgi:hypothetical protein
LKHSPQLLKLKIKTGIRRFSWLFVTIYACDFFTKVENIFQKIKSD